MGLKFSVNTLDIKHLSFKDFSEDGVGSYWLPLGVTNQKRKEKESDNPSCLHSLRLTHHIDSTDGCNWGNIKLYEFLFILWALKMVVGILTIEILPSVG